MYLDQLFSKAHTKHMQGKHEAAAKLYREILRIKPNHIDANYLLGTLYAEAGQLEDAEKYLSIAAGLNSASPYIKVNLGNIYKLQGNFDSAKKCFTEAIDLKDDLPQAHFGLGSILEDYENDLDKAYQEYQKTVDLSPDDPLILQAIGKTLAKLGNESAFDYYSRALLLNPNLNGIQKDIGLAALSFGQTTKAAKHLTIAQREDPSDVKVRYLLCVAEGREPDAELKKMYVQAEFDIYAANFEHTLTKNLEYDAPAKLLGFLQEACPDNLHFRNAVDLGCGTGLFGAVMKEYVDQLTGIDLSGNMIEQARKRTCYDQLIEGEIVSVLNDIDTKFDLFLASDLIIYVGAVETLFAAIKRKASANALLLLTTESCEGEQFILRNTGRYAHSHNYIESVAAANGFDIIASRETLLRKEGAEWLAGELFIIRADS